MSRPAHVEAAQKRCREKGRCEHCGWEPEDGGFKHLEAHHAIKVRHKITQCLDEVLVCLCQSNFRGDTRGCHWWADNNPAEFKAWFDSERGEGEWQRLRRLAEGEPVVAR